MLDPRHLVYGATCVHSAEVCRCVCYTPTHTYTQMHTSRRCTYLPRHKPDAPFAGYSPTLSARDVLGRASFLSLPLYEHARHRFKGAVYPLRGWPAPWPAMTITITQPSVCYFFFFSLSFDVACPCRAPRLAQSRPSCPSSVRSRTKSFNSWDRYVLHDDNILNISFSHFTKEILS